MSRHGSAAGGDAGPSKTRVVEVESRQRRAYAEVLLELGTPGVQLQDKLGNTVLEQSTAYKKAFRHYLKLKAEFAAYEAQLAAGILPPSLGPAVLRTQPHTGDTELDKAAGDFAQQRYRECLTAIAEHYRQQKQASIAQLSDKLMQQKTVTGPAALTEAFNSFVSGSSHAADADINVILTHSIKLLDLSLCAVENSLHEGAAVRESKLLAAAQRRIEQQQRQQQRQQNAGTTAATLAAAAAAAGAAAAVSAVAAAAPPAPTGAHEGAAAGEDAAMETDHMHPNQEQQQQEAQEHAASHAAMTPNQMAAALQAGITASITHLLQHGALPVPPTTPAQPKPRNRRQNRPRHQQQPRQQQPNRPARQQQQQHRPLPANRQQQQQQQPRRNNNAPNGPAPRQQAQPGRNPPRQPQQQPRRPANPGAAAGRTNANRNFRRTGNGGNNGPQGRQHSP